MGHFYNKLDEPDKALVDKAVKFHNEVCEDPKPNLRSQAFLVFQDRPALKSEGLAFLLITMREYIEPKLQLCISDSADLKNRIAALKELSNGDRVKNHVKMMQGVIQDAFCALVPDPTSESIKGAHTARLKSGAVDGGGRRRGGDNTERRGGGGWEG